MEISQRKIANVAIVDVSGRIVASENVGQLKDKVTSLIFQGDKNVVLNLANVNYVDSSGLGALVACHGSALRGGGSVKLANVTKRIEDLLIMTKLLTVFESFDSEEAAIASFGANAV
jgi:anti-sigma B factor antagonist